MSKTIHNIKLHYPPKTNLCRSCKHSYGDRKKGLMCEITNSKPEFYLYCPYFVLSKGRDDAVHSHDTLKTQKRVKLLELWVFLFVFIVFISPILDLIGSTASVFVIIGIVLLGYSIYNHLLVKQTQNLPLFAYTYIIFARYLKNFKTFTAKELTIIYQTLIRFYGNNIATLGMEIFKQDLNLTTKKLKLLLFFLSKWDKRLIYTLLFQLYIYNNAQNIEKNNVMVNLAKIFGISQDEYFRLKHILLNKEYEYQYQKKEKNRPKHKRQENLEYYFKILGLDSNASEQEIKRRFRYLAKLYHPDKQVNAEAAHQAQEQFRIILEAYKIIKQARNIK